MARPFVDRPAAASPFRRRLPSRYRVEWRSLVDDPCSDVLFDVHFETAANPSALRDFMLAMARPALGREFRIEAPDRRSVFTDIAAIVAWDPLLDALPRTATNSMWRAEVELGVCVDRMVADVRAAVMRAVDDGAIAIRDAIFVTDMARSVARRFPV